MLSLSLLLVLLYHFHTPSYADDVIWLPNKSINLASNFEDGKLPCSGQNIVFPETVEEGVLVSSLTISGLILPIDGEILLDDGEIVFGADPNYNCTRTGDSVYKDDQVGSWAQPDVWSSPRFNKATPDAEKIPCYNDTVIFPKKGQYSVQLPDQPQVIQAITINGVKSERPDDIEDLIKHQTNDLSQQFILSRPGMVRSSKKLRYYERCESFSYGCPCQYIALQIDCKLKYCPPPQCSHPIKPEGHCCELCGASLIINITDQFDMKAFVKSVNELVGSYGVDKFDYHVGLLAHQFHENEQTERVQVIVLDKGEYTGECKDVLSNINYMISEDWVKGNVLLYSGNPSSKSGEGGKIVVAVFFLVVAVMGAMFSYYYKPSLLGLRDIRQPHGMLSRLHRRTESVLSLARRDSNASTATMGTAFRNPLYSSMRERVQVGPTVAEEQ